MPSTRSKHKPNPNQDTEPFQYSFEAIGTHWIIEIFATNTSDNLKAVQKAVAKVIEDFDVVYSRFRKDSLITKISQAAGTYHFPKNADKLFALYRVLYDLTNGKFTPLIGNTLVDTGYDAQYSLVPKDTITSPSDWDDAMHYEKGALTVHKPVLLDFGAAGKGYLVDLVTDEIKKHGITEFCVNAGGDMRHVTTSGAMLPVALENPRNSTQAIGVAQLENGALCGSAGNRRVWGEYHHVIDPSSLQSPKHIEAIWAMAETCMVADALTTALYFVSPQDLSAHFAFEYAIMTSDSGLRASPDFRASFFT